MEAQRGYDRREVQQLSDSQRCRTGRCTALWYETRILAMLADAKLAAGDRSGARPLLS
jgi:hypothetical protein